MNGKVYRNKLGIEENDVKNLLIAGVFFLFPAIIFPSKYFKNMLTTEELNQLSKVKQRQLKKLMPGFMEVVQSVIKADDEFEAIELRDAHIRSYILPILNQGKDKGVESETAKEMGALLEAVIMPAFIKMSATFSTMLDACGRYEQNTFERTSNENGSVVIDFISTDFDYEEYKKLKRKHTRYCKQLDRLKKLFTLCEEKKQVVLN